MVSTLFLNNLVIIGRTSADRGREVEIEVMREDISGRKIYFDQLLVAQDLEVDRDLAVEVVLLHTNEKEVGVMTAEIET